MEIAFTRIIVNQSVFNCKVIVKRMKIIETNKYEVEMDRHELALILTCLNYCHHRLDIHGRTFADVKKVDEMRDVVRDVIK